MARPPKECEQPGCHNRHNARGMCKQHYKLWMIGRGDLKNGFKAVEETNFDDLWEFVKKELKLS